MHLSIVKGLALIFLVCANRTVLALDAADPATDGQRDQIAASRCPQECSCEKDARRNQLMDVDCSSRNLVHVPSGLHHVTSTLDLSINNISVIPPKAFNHLHFLEDLDLANNFMTTLHPTSFQGLVELQSLTLHTNRLENIEPQLFVEATNLRSLNLGANYMNNLEYGTFYGLKNLISLKLDDNRIRQVPTKALMDTSNLETIDLAVNSIEDIPDGAFQRLRNLRVLILRENRISSVGELGFAGLYNLNILSLEYNFISEFPTSLIHLEELVELKLHDNLIQYIPQNAFSKMSKLKTLMLSNNPLKSVATSAFTNLHLVTSIHIEHVKDQKEFPDFTGCEALQDLSVTGGRIASLPSNLCEEIPSLQFLSVAGNRLSNLSGLEQCTRLQCLDASRNSMKSLRADEIANLTKLENLDLSHNLISSLDDDVFENNPIRKLNLAFNYFTYLPVRGLRQLTHLNLTGVNNMLYLPPIQLLGKLQFLNAAFSYHCCQVRSEWQKAHHGQSPEDLQPHTAECFPDPGPLTPCIDLLPSVLARAILWLALIVSFVLNLVIIFSSLARQCVYVIRRSKHAVVAPAAGEGASRYGGQVEDTPVDPVEASELALCHLALADLLATVYVAVIATYDAMTRSDFAEYGAWWQQSTPCRAAGFFLVMGVQLGFFTVLVAAVERYLSTMFPLKPEKHIGKAVIGLTLSAAWVVSVATAIVTLFSGAQWYDEGAGANLPPYNGATCLPWSTDFPYVAVLIGGHLVACCAVAVVCVLMFCARRKQSWLSARKHTRTQIALIVACNVLFILPLALVGLLASAVATYPSLAEPFVGAPRDDFDAAEYISRELNLDLLLMLVLLFISLRLMLNPILYVAFNAGFRQDVQRLAVKILKPFRRASSPEVEDIDEGRRHLQDEFAAQPKRGRFQIDEAVKPELEAEMDMGLHESNAIPTFGKQVIYPPEMQLLAPQRQYVVHPASQHQPQRCVPTQRHPDWRQLYPVYRYQGYPSGGEATFGPTQLPPGAKYLYSALPSTSKDVECYVDGDGRVWREEVPKPPPPLPLQRARRKPGGNNLHVDVSKERLPPLPWQRGGEPDANAQIGAKLSNSCESSTSKDSGIQSEPDFFHGYVCSSGSDSLARSSQTSDASSSARIRGTADLGAPARCWVPNPDVFPAPVAKMGVVESPLLPGKRALQKVRYFRDANGHTHQRFVGSSTETVL